MKKKQYYSQLDSLQSELVQMQQWSIRENKRIVIIFEGRDAAGKGSTIKRIVQRLNPNHTRVVAKGKPTPEEESQKYFTRWRKTLPKDGELVIYDRSWYTRAGVEAVMGFATQGEVAKFYKDVRKFEKKLTNEGVIVIKYWLSITHSTQEKRFRQRLKCDYKRWKLSPMDLASRTCYQDYTEAKDIMFSKSNFKFSPWTVVDANKKKKCRLNVMKDILSRVPYEFKEIPPKELPEVELVSPSKQPINMKLIGFSKEQYVTHSVDSSRPPWGQS